MNRKCNLRRGQLAAKNRAVKSEKEAIEQRMYADAEPALRKLKSGKAKLYTIESYSNSGRKRRLEPCK